jgi:hypothetical protein
MNLVELNLQPEYQIQMKLADAGLNVQVLVTESPTKMM